MDERLHCIQEQVADFDPIDLYNARQAIRSEMEQDAVHKLQERYTDEYSYTTMVDGRREVSLMLDEYAEEQRIQQLKQEQQRKFQQERRQNHPLKKQKDRERYQNQRECIIKMLSRFLTVSQQRNHSVSGSERINLLIKALEIWWFSI